MGRFGKLRGVRRDLSCAEVRVRTTSAATDGDNTTHRWRQTCAAAPAPPAAAKDATMSLSSRAQVPGIHCAGRHVFATNVDVMLLWSLEIKSASSPKL